jgi:hypothetical protein
MAKSPIPLNPRKLSAIILKFGFKYHTLTWMLIFAVQIGCFDITPTILFLCKFNDRPGAIHFQIATYTMRYLRSTIDCGLIFWRPTDLPRGNLTHYRPKKNIDALFPRYFLLLEPVCFVDASCGGLLAIGEHRSITGIVIMLGGTSIYAKTRIQRRTALSST